MSQPSNLRGGWPFARVPRLVLLLLCVSIFLLLSIGSLTLTVNREPVAYPKPGGKSDFEIYAEVVQRVHDGENYYDALQHKFEELNYEVRSVVNYRPPLYAYVIGKPPHPIHAQAALVLAALATMLLSWATGVAEGGPVQGVLNMLLLLGPLSMCAIGDLFLYTEVWAGTLIAFSVCLYARGWWLPAVAVGLFALFYRELTLPYCLLMLGLALWRRQRAESAVWLGGLVLYAGFMAWHAAMVTPRITHPESGVALSWLRFGGLTFVLATCKVSNMYLINAPPWLTGIYLPLGLLGLAGWRGELALRARWVVGTYLIAFLFVGNPLNSYWGLMIAPLLALGVAQAPAVLWKLVQSKRTPTSVAAGEPRV